VTILSNPILYEINKSDRRVAIPTKHQHHPATGQQPHVSADTQRAGRCNADVEQISDYSLA